VAAGIVVATCGPPEAVPHAWPDVQATRNAPPTQFNPPDPALQATYEAARQARLPLPGESLRDYHQRVPVFTLCDQTMGKLVRNHHGVDVQLTPDECVVGESYAIVEGKPLLTIRKGESHHGTIRPDGEKLLVDLTRVRGKAQN
jgi:hypothetical protein